MRGGSVMTKQANANIGHIKCFSCGELAAVRKTQMKEDPAGKAIGGEKMYGGKLYYFCLECGKVTPNHAGGQRRIQERAVIWGAAGAPADVPAWIREQWPYAVAIRTRGKPEEKPITSLLGSPAESAGAAADQVAAAASPDPEDLPENPPPPPRKRAPKVPKESPRKSTVTRQTPPPPASSFYDEVLDEL